MLPRRGWLAARLLEGLEAEDADYLARVLRAYGDAEVGRSTAESHVVG